jgi:hypothetical protein
VIKSKEGELKSLQKVANLSYDNIFHLDVVYLAR